MNREHRTALTMAEQVNAAVSRIAGDVEKIAAESQWTAEQRFALRLVAGRLNSRTFIGFEKEQAAQSLRTSQEKLIRRLAVRIATLKPEPGEPAVLVIDSHIETAARALAAFDR